MESGDLDPRLLPPVETPYATPREFHRGDLALPSESPNVRVGSDGKRRGCGKPLGIVTMKNAVKGGRTLIGRRASERSRARYESSVRWDIVLADVLEIHALQRRVKMSVLVEDILCGWATLATDFRQAIFRETLPAGARLPEVPERYAGYLASLGFGVADQQEPLPVPVTAAPPSVAELEAVSAPGAGVPEVVEGVVPPVVRDATTRRKYQRRDERPLPPAAPAGGYTFGPESGS